MRRGQALEALKALAFSILILQAVISLWLIAKGPGPVRSSDLTTDPGSVFTVPHSSVIEVASGLTAAPESAYLPLLEVTNAFTVQREHTPNTTPRTEDSQPSTWERFWRWLCAAGVGLWRFFYSSINLAVVSAAGVISSPLSVLTLALWVVAPLRSLALAWLMLLAYAWLLDNYGLTILVILSPLIAYVAHYSLSVAFWHSLPKMSAARADRCLTWRWSKDFGRSTIPKWDHKDLELSVTLSGLRDKRFGTNVHLATERLVAHQTGAHLQLGVKRDALCSATTALAAVDAWRLSSFCVDECPGTGRYWLNRLVRHLRVPIHAKQNPLWHSAQSQLSESARHIITMSDRTPHGGIGVLSLAEWYYNDEALADILEDRVTYVVTHRLPKGQHQYKEFGYSRTDDGLIMHIKGGRSYRHAYRDWGPGAEPVFIHDRWSWRKLSVVRRAFQGEVIMSCPMVSADEIVEGRECPELLVVRVYPVVSPLDRDEPNLVRYHYSQTKLEARWEGVQIDFESVHSDDGFVNMPALFRAVHDTRHHARPMIPFSRLLTDSGEHRIVQAYAAGLRIQHLELVENFRMLYSFKHWWMSHLRLLASRFNHYVWRTGMVREGWTIQRSASELIKDFFRAAPSEFAGRDDPNAACCSPPSSLPDEGGDDGDSGCEGFLDESSGEQTDDDNGAGVGQKDGHIRDATVGTGGGPSDAGHSSAGSSSKGGQQGGSYGIRPARDNKRSVVFGSFTRRELSDLDDSSSESSAPGCRNGHEGVERDQVDSHLARIGQRRRFLDNASIRESLFDPSLPPVGSQIPRAFKSKPHTGPVGRSRHGSKATSAAVHEDGSTKRLKAGRSSHDRSHAAKGSREHGSRGKSPRTNSQRAALPREGPNSR